MSMQQTSAVLVFILLSVAAWSQEVRSIDGSGNNVAPAKVQWGAVGTELNYNTSNGYADAIAEPAGQLRPNPRIISNVLFDQKGVLAERDNRSDYIWIFGKFMDHEVSMVPNSEDATDFLPIVVQSDDNFFEEGDLIPLSRAARLPGSGTDPTNYRKTFNAVTSYIDGSAIYGSTQDRADWLRTFEGGKLKTSRGDLLPWNTIDGELGSPLDFTCPDMNMVSQSRRFFFVAGDVRANESPMMVAIHTLFVREHNRLCDEIISVNPDWTDEEIYQKARKLVGALLQQITYNEWLPSLGVIIRPYRGYNPEINPTVSNVFTAAAFQLGHTLGNSRIYRIDAHCQEIAAGHLAQRDVFYNPESVLLNGLEPILKGMCVQPAQRFDCKMDDDFRNLPLTDSGSTFKGIDFASILIQRGRERGLPDYNTIRSDFNLPEYDSFKQICRDPSEAGVLEGLYQSINNVDPWVGMLAEDPLPNTMFGELLLTIIKDQFTSLRDGDRFYFENDPGITEKEKNEIRSTRLSDILRRNTSLAVLQDDVFYAMSCEDMDFQQVPVITKELEFSLYPNPVSNDFTIKLYSDRQEEVIFRLVDQTGKSMREWTTQAQQGFNRVDMSLDNGITTGLYHLIIIKGESFAQSRIVKL